MFDTSFAFKPGKLTIALDASAGSSGKGKIGSFVTEYANNWQFAVNTFMPQAGHWVRLATPRSNGKEWFYQTFNSCAYNPKYEAIYLAPGCVIELPALWREIEENKIPRNKIKISPLASILQDIDAKFEKGIVDFDGNPVEKMHDGTMKKGTTAHGCGANRARRVLRRPEAKYARDIPELEQFMCDVPREIMKRLDSGQSGLLEIAQGFQLSYLLSEFFPYCTSRNCTTMAGMDDAMLPVHYAGNVIINCRTFPIRINNKKFIGKDGKHLTWAEVQAGVEHTVYEGNSGPGYLDQEELTWEELTKRAGSPTPIMEITSVTKLPRRVFTFSKQNLHDAIQFNRANGEVFLSINFMNYVDADINGKCGVMKADDLPQRTKAWLDEYIPPHKDMVRFVGTGANLEDQILIQ